MKIVTSGRGFLDIDAYACMYAYAELQNQIGDSAVAVSLAPWNVSISKTVVSWNAKIERTYQADPADTFAIVDLSDPNQFEEFVPAKEFERISAVIDHHPGFQDYWKAKIGQRADIREVGASATQIYQYFKEAGVKPSKRSARLLLTAILDNTLNLTAHITSEEDRTAYKELVKRADLGADWPKSYFHEVQTEILQDIETAVRLDAKYLDLPELGNVRVGQLAIWDTQAMLARETEIYKALGIDEAKIGFMNLIDIQQNRSSFLVQNKATKSWLENQLDVQFSGDIAQSPRSWLRKEIAKKVLQNKVNSRNTH